MSESKPQGSATTSGATHATAPGDARPAKFLMAATYVTGVVGLFIGFMTVNNDPPSLTWAVLLVVVAGGGLSFVRHSLFPGSDSVRLGWTSERRNNFQIEVGIANFAWAAVALLAVVFDWGIQVQAATLLLLSSGDDRARSMGPVVAMAAFGVLQIILGMTAIGTT